MTLTKKNFKEHCGVYKTEKYTECDPILDEIFKLIRNMYITGDIRLIYKQPKLQFWWFENYIFTKKSNAMKCEEHRTTSLITHTSENFN